MPLVVAVLPVLALALVLRVLDSYKLVRLPTLALSLAGGAAMAAAAYGVHALLLQAADIPLATFSRYVAPITEEALKGAVVLLLIRQRRIGFLVDAALLGFAVGAGFAAVENAHYVHIATGASMTTWVVRGFGTALMHGGATATFAVIALSALERRPAAGWPACLPALLPAALLHGLFNHLGAWPQIATLSMMIGVPLTLMLVFQRSERLTAAWLGEGFDADTDRLELLHSGRFSSSPSGQYLMTLRRAFDGPVVADALCYVRLHTELALRAKGRLMLRENGLPLPPIDETTRGHLDELRFLEKSIGPTGLRALQPLLPMTPKELRQIHLLEGA